MYFKYYRKLYSNEYQLQTFPCTIIEDGSYKIKIDIDLDDHNKIYYITFPFKKIFKLKYGCVDEDTIDIPINEYVPNVDKNEYEIYELKYEERHWAGGSWETKKIEYKLIKAAKKR